jgi:hypothetical protein
MFETSMSCNHKDVGNSAGAGNGKRGLPLMSRQIPGNHNLRFALANAVVLRLRTNRDARTGRIRNNLPACLTFFYTPNAVRNSQAYASA